MSRDRLHLHPAVLTALFQVDRPVDTLGRTVWLYLALVVAANYRGVVIRMRTRLAEELSVSEETIDTWLDRLAKADLILIKAPSPYLVIVLRFWSGKAVRTSASSPKSSGSSSSARKEVPVSSQQLAAADENSGDGGLGEGAALHAEARAVLGDGDEVAALVARHPAPIVRRALQRVRATPARQIKRSKLALFRFLLVHFSTHTHE